MNNDLVASETITIIATPEKVWKALTTPEIIKEYLFGTNTVTDWKIGSNISFEGEYNGQTYRDGGIIKENIPNKLLSYTYWSGFSGLPETEENHALVTYKLESDDNIKTKFSWIQKGFSTKEGCEHSQSGMKEFLEKIKAIVEKL